ncbi:MAG TPA: LysM peptidoglycan-binding domain-containing protein [Campylobacterales bacterium]|nr:LysM peptidoglycan-binding domain-containing protein [Campylobacterales bacterium]
MFDTNDVFNDAVRGSTIHADDSSVKSGIGSKVLTVLLLTGITYVGFNYYSPTSNADKTLVAKNELVAKIQVESELQVTAKLSNSEAEYLSALREIESELIEERAVVSLDTSRQMNLSSEMTNITDDKVLVDNTKYTNALRKEIGVEVNKVEKSFSSAMSEFDDAISTNNKSNIEANDKLEMSLSLAMSQFMDDRETAVDVSKTVLSDSQDSRVIVVKKGDTLQGISNKFYGDAMKYKRIIASNASLISNDTIYVGQTIVLP